MSRVYDCWEKLVGAVLKREALRQLALCESFSSSSSVGFSSRFSFDSALEDASYGSRDWGETGNQAAIPSHSGVQEMKFKEIKKATKDFRSDMFLGEGAFGVVYKGWIDERTLKASKRESGIAIAVKRNRQGSMHGREEWLKEINYLSQLRHPNLVKLIGYCSEEDNLILVYQFMSKGSLDNHLFGRGHHPLSWATRIGVATDVARGLSFLHDLPTPVIHQGVQCNNILLDGEFNAKLSDFGLARDGPTGDMTHVSTVIRSTYGYTAPECIARGHLTTKCDVYSFGIVLLELLFGRQVCVMFMAGEQVDFVERARNSFKNRKVRQIMDTKLEGEYPLLKAFAVGMLALQCLSNVPKERPTMAEVLFALENLGRYKNCCFWYQKISIK